jgi:hypothetical protein
LTIALIERNRVSGAGRLRKLARTRKHGPPCIHFTHWLGQDATCCAPSTSELGNEMSGHGSAVPRGAPRVPGASGPTVRSLPLSAVMRDEPAPSSRKMILGLHSIRLTTAGRPGMLSFPRLPREERLWSSTARVFSRTRKARGGRSLHSYTSRGTQAAASSRRQDRTFAPTLAIKRSTASPHRRPSSRSHATETHHDATSGPARA